MNNEIVKNHEKFKSSNDAIEKMRIAARNIAIQLKAVNISMDEMQLIAKSQGFRVDVNTGELIKL